MFELIRTNKRFAQVVLAIIILPFAFFGVNSMSRNSGAPDDVAKVGDQSISKIEFDNAMRTVRRSNPDLDETPKVRKDVLDNLIDQKVLRLALQKNEVSVSDDLVRETVINDPNFQENGQFSKRLYDERLSGSGITPDEYEGQIRNGLAAKMLLEPIQNSGLASLTSIKQLLAIEAEQRVVAKFVIKAKSDDAQIKLPADAVQKYYDENKATLFQQPERIKAEYVILSVDDLAKQSKFSEAELKKWYDEHAKEDFSFPEERRASHILISVEKNATKEQKEIARKHAEEVLAQVKANPADFAKIAEKESKDTLSAEKGGDLGFFRFASMVEPFSKAAFALKDKEISDLVETDFGFHIIEVTAIHPAGVKPFEDVRAEVLDRASREAAEKRFSEATSEFGDLIFNHNTTFEPVKTKLGIAVQKSDWIERDQAASAGVLGNKKFLAALFSANAIKTRENTDTVLLMDGLLAAGRVIDYQAKTVKPLDEVRAGIEQKLRLEQAIALAKKEGESQLAKLKAGEPVSVSWGATATVKRADRSLSPKEVNAIFGVKLDKAPAYTGVETSEGYALYRVDSANKVDIKDTDPSIAAYQSDLNRLLGNQDLQAFMMGLREKYVVKILKDVGAKPSEE